MRNHRKNHRRGNPSSKDGQMGNKCHLYKAQKCDNNSSEQQLTFRNPDVIRVFYVGPEVIVIHRLVWSSQPRIRVPGSPFLLWPGSNRHDQSSSSHRDLENLQNPVLQTLSRGSGSRLTTWRVVKCKGVVVSKLVTERKRDIPIDRNHLVQ